MYVPVDRQGERIADSVMSGVSIVEHDGSKGLACKDASTVEYGGVVSDDRPLRALMHLGPVPGSGHVGGRRDTKFFSLFSRLFDELIGRAAVDNSRFTLVHQ